MSKIARQLKSAINWLYTAFGFVGAVTVIPMTAIIMVDVIGRYFFNAPIIWSLEINQYLLVSCVFLGLAYTEAHEGHVRVFFVYNRLSPKVRTILDIVVRLLILSLFVRLTQETASMTMHAMQTGEVAVAPAETPSWPSQITMPVGCFLMCLVVVSDFCKYVRSLFQNTTSGQVEVPHVRQS